MQIIFTDGLGNQMFQYALYLAMRHRGLKPCINTGLISRKIVHNGFELCDDFIIEKKDLKIINGGRFGGGVTTFIIRYLKCLCAIEGENVSIDTVLNTSKPIVYGYWQDESLFSNIAEEVRHSFTFRSIDEKNKKLGVKMSLNNSVSLHIRRGDYLKYPFLQVCTDQYYKEAVEYIKKSVDDPVFYVFSDDLEWSENFIKGCDVDYCIVNYNRGSNSYKDLYLMTCCRHNIIANSTFSWWGAWLGLYSEKIVVCPSIWTKDKRGIEPQLKKWIKIEI